MSSDTQVDWRTIRIPEVPDCRIASPPNKAQQCLDKITDFTVKEDDAIHIFDVIGLVTTVDSTGEENAGRNSSMLTAQQKIWIR